MLVKKMPAILEYYDLGLRNSVRYRPQPRNRTELITVAMNEQYRLFHRGQKIEIPIFLDRCPDRYKPFDPVVGHPDLHSCTRAERKSRERHVLTGIFVCEPVKRVGRVFDTALDLVVHTCRGTHAAKVEFQRRKAGVYQSSGCTEYDLIMHRPAAQRMRMADQAYTFPRACRLLKNALKLAVRG